jgi:molybdopterin-containing oxidoreductase family iron-sulfur binding subunit
MARKILIINSDDCIGCHSCAVICKQENNVDLGTFWNKVLTVGPSGEYPNLEMYYQPTMCQHCDNPQCVNVCPTGASHKREDGIVLVDHEKCVGCQYCIMACPYGVRHYTLEKGVIEKCTLCAQRIDNGGVPACASICPGQARIFGDLDDPDSDVSKAVRDAGENLHKLTDVGNHPGVGYILKNMKWRG